MDSNSPQQVGPRKYQRVSQPYLQNASGYQQAMQGQTQGGYQGHQVPQNISGTNYGPIPYQSSGYGSAYYQQYQPTYYMPTYPQYGAQPATQPARQTVTKRERKPIKICDPNTGKEVVIGNGKGGKTNGVDDNKPGGGALEKKTEEKKKDGSEVDQTKAADRDIETGSEKDRPSEAVAAKQIQPDEEGQAGVAECSQDQAKTESVQTPNNAETGQANTEIQETVVMEKEESIKKPEDELDIKVGGNDIDVATSDETQVTSGREEKQRSEEDEKAETKEEKKENIEKEIIVNEAQKQKLKETSQEVPCEEEAQKVCKDEQSELGTQVKPMECGQHTAEVKVAGSASTVEPTPKTETSPDIEREEVVVETLKEQANEVRSANETELGEMVLTEAECANVTNTELKQAEEKVEAEVNTRQPKDAGEVAQEEQKTLPKTGTDGPQGGAGTAVVPTEIVSEASQADGTAATDADKKQEQTNVAKKETLEKINENEEGALDRTSVLPEAQASESAGQAATENRPVSAAQDSSSNMGEPTEPPTKKRALNLFYPKDVWSPENPNGKKHYPIDFLMQFKDSCKLPPEDAVIEKEITPGYAHAPSSNRTAPPGRNGRMSRTTSQDSRYDNKGPYGGFGGPQDYFMARGPVQRQQSGGLPRTGSRSNRQMGREGSRDGRRSMSQAGQAFAMDESYTPLVPSENAWKPRVITPAELESMDPEKRKDVEDETLFRKMKALLNKLTLDKFEKLTNQIMELEINTPKRLETSIVLVFDKALDEPNFASMYADLCCRLGSIELPPESLPNDTGKRREFQFRRMLLNKCQVEFEKERSIPAQQDGIAAENEDEKIVRARLRMFGNIKFIGELFKRKMLQEKIIHYCIDELLRSSHREESLECLCKLLTTVGEVADHREAKNHMDAYFKRLTSISKEDDIQPRIKFMIEEVCDLRANNWKPRRAEFTPKTIDEVHREAAKEAHRAPAQLNYHGSGGFGRTSSQGGRQGGGGQQNYQRGGGAYPSPDGWNTVKSRFSSSDINALRNLRSNSSDGRKGSDVQPENTRFGPGGAWHNQNRASTPNRSQSTAGTGSGAFSMANSFAALHVAENEGELGGSGGVRSRSRDNRGDAQPVSNLWKQKPQRPSLNTPPRTPNLGNRGSQASAPLASPKVTAAPSQPTIDLKRKTQSMLGDFYSTNNASEAIRDAEEIISAVGQTAIVEELFRGSLESKTFRPMAVKLLAACIEQNTIGTPELLAGLDSQLSTMEDIVVDAPKAYDYLAEYLVPTLACGPVTLSALGELKQLQTIRSSPSSGASKFIVAVLSQLSVSQGVETAEKMWRESNLKFTDFVEEGSDSQKALGKFAETLGFLLE